MFSSISKKNHQSLWLGIIIGLFFTFIFFPFITVDKAQAADKEMKLTMASYVPVGYPYVYGGQKIFVDMVNEKGKGIVQIDMFWGGTLLKGKQLLPGLQAGTADIIFHTGAYLLGSYPIIGVQILPVWGDIKSAYAGLKIGTPLAKLQNQEMKKKNLYQLANAGMVPEFLWTKNKLVRSPKDIKGLKIRVAGKVEGKVIQILGGSPVTMPSAELAQALQRGVVDGALMNPWTAKARGVEEFCKYMLIMPLTCQTTPIYIMRDTWDSWPENVRKIIKECAVKWEPLYISDDPKAILHDFQLQTDLIPFYQKKGMQAIFLTSDEKKAFVDAIKPVVKWWLKKTGDAGKEALKYTDYKD